MVVGESDKCDLCAEVTKSIPCVVEGYYACTGCDTSSWAKRGKCKFSKTATDEQAQTIIDNLLEKDESERAKDRRLARLEVKAFESRTKWLNKDKPEGISYEWVGPAQEDSDEEGADGAEVNNDGEEAAGPSQTHHASTSDNVDDGDVESSDDYVSAEEGASGPAAPAEAADVSEEEGELDEDEAPEPEPAVEVDELDGDDDDDDDDNDAEELIVYPQANYEEEVDELDPDVKLEPNEESNVEPEPVTRRNDSDRETGSPAESVSSSDGRPVTNVNCVGTRYDAPQQHNEPGYLVNLSPSQLRFKFSLSAVEENDLVPPRSVAVLDRIEVITPFITDLFADTNPDPRTSITFPPFMYRVRIPCRRCNKSKHDCVVSDVIITKDGHLDLKELRCLSCEAAGKPAKECRWFALEGHDDADEITRVVDFAPPPPPGRASRR